MTDYIDFEITEDIYKNKKLLCLEDVYTELGMLPDLNTVAGLSSTEKFDYHNIRANKDTQDKIYDAIKYNLIKTKNKYSRAYKEKYLESMCAMNFLCFSPFTDNTIPNEIIRLYTVENPDFIYSKE